MENYVGKRLDGRYEIIEIIGVGGMAVVYKAFDNIDNRIVAVKILKNEYIENEEFRHRFKNESKAIAVLSHPNIVKVYDVSYGNLIQYIVMEHVDGITLKEYIEQQGVINIREALHFLTQILHALQHAHDKGIIHRDIKPQNILLLSDGTIKVTDFGIARISRSETKTMTGEAIGSVHYISPEQVKGSVTDARSDIYSVGVVFYEMLTGKLPFESDNTAQLIFMQIQNDPVMPHEINADIPVGLEQITLKSMQKNQNYRYQSASEMLMDIEKFRRNPNIKFDFTYFVDKQPTKYIPKPQNITGDRDSSEPKVVSPVEDDDFDEVENERKSKKTIAILGGILAALIIAAIILVAIFVPKSNKHDVPNLVGLDFTQDVLNNEKFSMFKFEIIDDETSDKEDGTIVRQEPFNGKLEEGETIVVYVAASSKQTEVPDVYGYNLASAQTIIRENNFDVRIEKEANKDYTPGTVIRTEPAKGEMADDGSVVVIFVADSDDPEPVDVPNLMGMTIAEAKAALEEVGLKLDTARTEYRSNEAERGTIIGYEFLGEQVEEGTAVAVYVSTGKLVEETTTEPETTTKEEATTEKETTTKPKEETTKKPEATTEEKTTKKPKETKPSEVTTEKPKETKPTEEKTTNKEVEETTTKKFITTVPRDE